MATPFRFSGYVRFEGPESRGEEWSWIDVDLFKRLSRHLQQVR
jgi:hypothetical protein